MVGRVAVVVVGLIPALSVCAPAAFASHGKTAASGYLAYSNWSVCNGGLEQGREGIVRAVNILNAETDVNASIGSCDSENVSAWSGSYPESWCGLTTCTATGTNGRCGRKVVRLNSSAIFASSNPAQQWNKTAIHEMGHVGGLGHRNVSSSCMASGEAPPIVAVFDSHDIAELNATYV